MSRLFKLSLVAAGIFGAWLGTKTGDEPAIDASLKGAPKTAKVLVEPAAAKSKLAVAGTTYVDARITKAAQAFTTQIAVMAPKGPAMQALAAVVEDLKGKPVFAEAALAQSFAALNAIVLEAETAGLFNGTLKGDALTAALKRDGVGERLVSSVQLLLTKLKTAERGEFKNIFAAKKLYDAAARKHPVLAELETRISLSYAHMKYAQDPNAVLSIDYTAEVTKLESTLKAPIGKDAVGTVVAKGKTAPKAVIIDGEAAGLSAAEVQMSRILLKPEAQNAIMQVKIAMGKTSAGSSPYDSRHVDDFYQQLVTEQAQLLKAPDDKAQIRVTTIITKQLLDLMRSTPRYEEVLGASREGAKLRQSIDRTYAALDVYEKAHPFMRTRCGQGIRGFGCG